MDYLFKASFIVKAFEGNHGPEAEYYLLEVWANGQLLPLGYPYFFHIESSQDQFVADLGAWMDQNGWRYESISFASILDTNKKQYYDVSITGPSGRN
ncbi:MAG: hypothetical protein H6557_22645 [Lewinellaceae bacterium]|nr:hypothetical protein [Phaeodactylibacter sp.]MCB9039425.1 hypothetical protein [Lewinellaceae bacterium]